MGLLQCRIENGKGILYVLPRSQFGHDPTIGAMDCILRRDNIRQDASATQDGHSRVVARGLNAKTVQSF